MTGHHELQLFALQEPLPPNWKPFAAFYNNGVVWVVCRKWVRDEKTTQEEERS